MAAISSNLPRPQTSAARFVSDASAYGQPSVLHGSLTGSAEQALSQVYGQPTALLGSLLGSAQQAFAQAVRHSHTVDQPFKPPLDHSLSAASLPAGALDSLHRSMSSLQQQQGPLHGSLLQDVSLPQDQQGQLQGSSGQAASIRNQQGQLQGSEGQAAPSLQLPAHVQQWLAALAQSSQPGLLDSSVTLDPPRVADQSVPKSSDADRSAEVQQGLTQLREELADVKAQFADTQVGALRLP